MLTYLNDNSLIENDSSSLFQLPSVSKMPKDELKTGESITAKIGKYMLNNETGIIFS